MTSQFHPTSKTQNPHKSLAMQPKAHTLHYKGDIVFYVTPTKAKDSKVPEFDMNLYETLGTPNDRTANFDRRDLSSIVEHSDDSRLCVDNYHAGSPRDKKEIFRLNDKTQGTPWEGKVKIPKKKGGLVKFLENMRRPLPQTYQVTMNEVLATEKLINQRKFNDSVNNSSFRKRAKDSAEKNLLSPKKRKTDLSLKIEYVGPSINNFKIVKSLRNRYRGSVPANVWKFDKKNYSGCENRNIDAVQYSATPDKNRLISTAGGKCRTRNIINRGSSDVGGGSVFCDTVKLNVTNYNFNRHKFCFGNQYEKDTVKSNARKLMRKTFNRTMSPLTFDKFNSSKDLTDLQP
jgi:hypothetical protein